MVTVIIALFLVVYTYDLSTILVVYRTEQSVLFSCLETLLLDCSVARLSRDSIAHLKGISLSVGYRNLF